MKTAALILALLFPSARAAAQASTGTATSFISLSLEQCERLAVDNATLVLKTGYAAETAGVALLQGYAQFLPALTANVQYSRNWGHNYLVFSVPELEETDNYGSAYQVATDLNLFNGLADRGALSAAIARDKSARLSLERARQSVALDVVQSYLQVILDQEFTRIQESNLATSREREGLLTEQTRVGITSLVDLYQQQALTSANQNSVIAAREKTRDDLLFLVQKVRLDLTKDYQLQPVALSTSAAPLPEEASLLAYALTRRPDLTAARQALNAAAGDVVVARAGYYPTLDLAFGASTNERYYKKEILNGVNARPADQPGAGPQLSDHFYYTFALALNWFIFSRLATRLASARATQEERDARVDYEDVRLAVESDVRRGVGDYGAALESVKAAETGLAAAKLAYEAQQARYQVKAASFVDLITAQSAFISAQATRAQAVVQLALEASVIQYAIGNDPKAGG